MLFDLLVCMGMCVLLGFWILTLINVWMVTVWCIVFGTFG